jgi:3-phosphoglycerate kinase
MIKFLTNSVAKKYRGKTCLLRIDLNIEPGAPLDSYRLEAIIPTIKLLLKNKIKMVILSHRGRPAFAKASAGKPKGSDRRLSLRPFARVSCMKLGRKVDFVSNFDFGKIKSTIEKSKPGSILLLENLRFLSGEEKNDAKLAKQLASLGDFYVNDAFAVSHRKNASLVAITKYLPSYGGLLMEKEIKNLGGILKYPTHPFIIVLGGAKIKEKIFDLRKVIQKADDVLLGSNAFNEFGIPGSSKITWPEDGKKHEKFIWDIGPFTIGYYASVIGKSKTIIWNGPTGFFEKKGFEKGTIGIWKAVLKNRKAHIVIGGGETVASAKLISNFEFRISNLRNVCISTGGGAMLDYLSGKKLPGIEALKR